MGEISGGRRNLLFKAVDRRPFVKDDDVTLFRKRMKAARAPRRSHRASPRLAQHRNSHPDSDSGAALKVRRVAEHMIRND